MKFSFLVFLTLLFSTSLFSNPFQIKLDDKAQNTLSDYQNVQSRLSNLHIEAFLTKFLDDDPFLENHEKDLIFKRCCRGANQLLVDPGRNLNPTLFVKTIGKGGDDCFVSCVPFNTFYPEFMYSCAEALEKSGFDGNFIFQVGGFPNPTGSELQYAAVPYCFKIFMMLEAYNLGFNKIIWIDSSLLCLNNPKILFDELKDKEALLLRGNTTLDHIKAISAKAKEVLELELGSLFDSVPYTCTLIFGLDLSTERSKEFISEYYRMVALGIPFISALPEEFVISSILKKVGYGKNCNLTTPRALGHMGRGRTIEEQMLYQKKRGTLFYYRVH